MFSRKRKYNKQQNPVDRRNYSRQRRENWDALIKDVELITRNSKITRMHVGTIKDNRFSMISKSFGTVATNKHTTGTSLWNYQPAAEDGIPPNVYESIYLLSLFNQYPVKL